MDKLIKKYFENTYNLVSEKDMIKFLNSLKNEEVIIHKDTLISSKRATDFYKEKFDMQTYFPENKKVKGFENLLNNLKRINLDDFIRVSNISTSKESYILFELEEKKEVIGLLQGFETLEFKNKYIKELIERKKNIPSLSINLYRFIEGELVEHIH